MSSDHVWPMGGELDIAEFANDQPNLVAWWCTPATYFWTICFLLDFLTLENSCAEIFDPNLILVCVFF